MSLVTDVDPFADPRATPRTASSARAGQVAGPLFLVVSALQLPLNPGFDLTWHAFSLLSLGPHGSIQQANFVVLGVLNLLASGALRCAGPTEAESSACLGCATALAVVPVVSGQPNATVTLYLVVSTAFVFTSVLIAHLHARTS